MTDGPGWVAPAVGTRGTWTRTFHADAVATYAALTGDHDPLHVDEGFARATRPGGLIIHGGLTTGLFNASPRSCPAPAASSCTRSGTTRRRSTSATP